MGADPKRPRDNNKGLSRNPLVLFFCTHARMTIRSISQFLRPINKVEKHGPGAQAHHKKKQKEDGPASGFFNSSSPSLIRSICSYAKKKENKREPVANRQPPPFNSSRGRNRPQLSYIFIAINYCLPSIEFEPWRMQRRFRRVIQ